MSNEDLHASSDAVLTRLVGDPGGGARLREDQWRAIVALVADRIGPAATGEPLQWALA